MAIHFVKDHGTDHLKVIIDLSGDLIAVRVSEDEARHAWAQLGHLLNVEEHG